MTKSALWCAALIWPAVIVSAKDPAPATPPPTPLPATPSAAEVSPEEARKKLSEALGTYFANRQKSVPNAEPIDVASFKKGLSDVLKTKDRSYALGAQFAGQLVHDALDVNVDDIAAAFTAVTEGKEPLATQQQVNDEIQKLQNRLREKQKELADKEAAKYEAEGKVFLDKNRTAEGVQVTPSGLQYKVLQPAKDADAPRPTADDSVVCHYRGTLLDGTEFDKSPESEPRTFGLRGVIKGWTEGIPLMQVGSKYRFWVPASLAYGSSPRPGGVIKPGHALVFDVELVSIAPRTATPAPTPGQAGRPAPGERAVATTPPIAVEMKDGKPVVRQVTPEQEAEAIRKAQEAEKAAPKKEAEKKGDPK
ncbi:MAG: FKBP-type peptidyl-prolyl cis-trans isomerase [Verrucomicrobiales bacterium]